MYVGVYIHICICIYINTLYVNIYIIYRTIYTPIIYTHKFLCKHHRIVFFCKHLYTCIYTYITLQAPIHKYIPLQPIETLLSDSHCVCNYVYISSHAIYICIAHTMYLSKSWGWEFIDVVVKFLQLREYSLVRRQCMITLQHIATHCNTLRIHVQSAKHCNTLYTHLHFLLYAGNVWLYSCRHTICIFLGAHRILENTF